EPAALPQGAYGALFAAARARLEKLGGTAVEVPFEIFDEAARLLYQGPWLEERKVAFGGFADAHPDAVLPVIKKILSGANYSAAEAFRGYYRLRELRAQAAALFAGIDALAVPTAPEHPTRAQVEADPIGANARLGRYVNFVNLLDLSALAVPAGFANGLPFGISLIGPAFTEARLAALGARFHAGQDLGMGIFKHPVPEPAAAEAAGPALPRLAVAGLHLSGQPLNHQLTSLGARLVKTVRTAPAYTLHVLTRGDRTFPGLARAQDGREGGPIELEVWEMTETALGAFLAHVREPLCIGTVELEGGEKVKGFLCEAQAVTGAPDITALGGWRGWLRKQA